MENNAVSNQLITALEKKDLRLNYQLSFPQYNIIPDDVRLALNILKAHKMKITIALEDIAK